MGKIITIIIILLLILGAYYLFRGDAPELETNNNVPDQNDLTVIYTDSGFSPGSVAIEAGDTVNFENQSSKDMWVASAMHPTHIVYSGTSLSEHCPDAENDSFDQCEIGDSFSFKFNKVGTWNYHDHITPSSTGSVIVQ